MMAKMQLMVGLAVFVLLLIFSMMGSCVSAPGDCSREAAEEQNRAIVLRMYDEAFGQGKTDIINELFSEDYIQRNPLVPSGREGLVGYIQMLRSVDPAQVLIVKHILADGDLVAVHWHSSTAQDSESEGKLGFDLFRLDNGKIVEYYCGMIPEASGNSASNGML